MTDTKIYAWIFLTIRELPTSLSDVLFSADGINRAEPRLNELQASFGWLQAQGLVRKVGNEYLLTETGIALNKSISCGNIFSIWNTIAERFSQLPEIDFQLDDITEKQVATARRINHKRYREIMQKLNEEEKSKGEGNACT